MAQCSAESIAFMWTARMAPASASRACSITSAPQPNSPKLSKRQQHGFMIFLTEKSCRFQRGTVMRADR